MAPQPNATIAATLSRTVRRLRQRLQRNRDLIQQLESKRRMLANSTRTIDANRAELSGSLRHLVLRTLGRLEGLDRSALHLPALPAVGLPDPLIDRAQASPTARALARCAHLSPEQLAWLLSGAPLDLTRMDRIALEALRVTLEDAEAVLFSLASRTLRAHRRSLELLDELNTTLDTTPRVPHHRVTALLHSLRILEQPDLEAQHQQQRMAA